MRCKGESAFGSILKTQLEFRPMFLIDLSRSMHRYLDGIKKDLTAAITELTYRSEDCYFNIIAFSDVVKSWASSVLPCSLKNIEIASQWIRNLHCSDDEESSLKDALKLALEDAETDGIYIITDGISIQNSSGIIKHIAKIQHCCPVHFLHVTNSRKDHRSETLMENIAELTSGKVHSLSLYQNDLIQNRTEYHYLDHDDYDDSYNVVDDDRRFNGSKKQVRFGSKSQKKDVLRLNGRNGTMMNNFLDSEEDTFSEELDGIKDYLRLNKMETLSKSAVDSSFHLNSMAASLMIGLQVLAKNSADGLFYLGKVVDVTANEDFCVEFDGCSSLHKKSRLQNASINDVIAYEDAIRHDICIGDKVLAPFNNLGSYAPGTVVEGVDRRKFHGEGEFGSIFVTFYNGESAEVKTGASIWISDDVFEKIRMQLYYPESLRRQSGTASVNFEERKAPKINGYISTSTAMSEDSFSVSEDLSRDHLKERVERQIEEGKNLLRKLKLENLEGRKTVRFPEHAELELERPKSRGRRIDKMAAERVMHSINTWPNGELPVSFVQPKRDAWGASMDELPTREQRKSIAAENHLKEEGYHKHRLELLNHWEKHKHAPKYTPIPPEPPVQSREAAREERPEKTASKRRQRPRRNVRYKTAATTKPNWKSSTSMTSSAKQYLEPRPRAKEYQSFDGINFPSRVDRKFHNGDMSKSWTPARVESNFHEPKIDIITNKPAKQYSTNFINGFGSRDMDRHKKESLRTEVRKVAREEREQQIVDNQARMERVARSREISRRLGTERRENRRQEKIRKFKEGEEKNQSQKQEIREAIQRFFKDKEESAQRNKYERIKAKQSKRVDRDEKYLLHDHDVVEPKGNISKSPVLDEKRRNAFEAGLQCEIRQQELKLERLKKIHNARLNKDDVRRDRAFKSKDLNYYVKDGSTQACRASILP